MPSLRERDEALKARIHQMREYDDWHLWQDFCCRCLAHMGYKDLRLSRVRNDYGRDAVGLHPDGRPCFVAVSFDGRKSKVTSDAKRWTSDPNREPAELMVFMTWDGPQETKLSQWREQIKRDHGLDLLIIHKETLIATPTHEAAWDEFCQLLSIGVLRRGFTRIAPYDSQKVRELLNVRPREILASPLPRQELGGRRLDANCLVLGKPGAGKTTAIFLTLEQLKPDTTFVIQRDFSDFSQAQRLADALAWSGGVIVFDDIQERPQAFKTFCEVLLASRPQNVVLLAAARSTDWSDVQAVVPPTYFEDTRLTGRGVLRLNDLSLDECRRLIVLCRDEWNLDMEEHLLEIAARSAVRGDATPLYVISMLAPVRGRTDRKVADADVAGLPQDVVGLWRGEFGRLDAHCKSVLRLVKLFWSAATAPQKDLLYAAADRQGLQKHDVRDALERLENLLWVARQAGAPSCLDVQLEAISLFQEDYTEWDRFVLGFTGPTDTLLLLLNGTGGHYAQVRKESASSEAQYRLAVESGLAHFVRGLENSRDGQERALFLNNASNLYSDLATLETTREGRSARLEKAVAYAEEAIGIHRQLGLQAFVATSLSNASNRYSDLATLETTREGRRARLEKAVAYAEEAIGIYRQLGLPADVAMSLNNAANRYSDLATLETTREGRGARLEKAVAYTQEAIGIHRQLGLQAAIGTSLNNASNLYSELATLETEEALRVPLLEKAAAASQEAVEIFRQVGNPAHLLTALGNAVTDGVSLAAVTHQRVAKAILDLCDEGRDVASEYGDPDRAERFASFKRAIERGDADM